MASPPDSTNTGNNSGGALPPVDTLGAQFDAILARQKEAGLEAAQRTSEATILGQALSTLRDAARART